MPYLHLSLQAGDDMILKRMKRRHCRADALKLIARGPRRAARHRLRRRPDRRLPHRDRRRCSTTPCRWSTEAGLAFLHVFPFSPRPGTPAARMPQVPRAWSRPAPPRLRAAGEAALARHLERQVGRTLAGLVERPGVARAEDFTEIAFDRRGGRRRDRRPGRHRPRRQAGEAGRPSGGRGMSWSGGCQCGAVRFRVEGELGRASICHCRMCQKAFGAFCRAAGLGEDRSDHLDAGEPKRFQSSNRVARGFCADCGTPLTFEWSKQVIELAIGAFDRAAVTRPRIQMAVGARDALVRRPRRPADQGPEEEAATAGLLTPPSSPTSTPTTTPTIGRRRPRQLLVRQVDQNGRMLAICSNLELESNPLADGQVFQQARLAYAERLGSRGPVQRFHRLVGDGDPTGIEVDHLHDPNDFRLGEGLGGRRGRWRRRRAAW